MPDDTPPPCVRVRVPAKINPFLAVGGIRDDGYHELVTVLQTVALHDQLELAISADHRRLQHPTSGGRVSVRFTHDAGPTVPAGPDNLVVRAAVLLAEATGLTVEDGASVRCTMDLAKRIPIAGGMAGGSADAAAALLGLNELWGIEVPRPVLADLAAALGADVPFCLVGGTALATGTGTGFARVLCRGTFDWVVCTAAEELSTPAVYRAWDDHCTPTEVQPDAVLAAITAGDPEALGAAIYNDLQPAAEVLLPRLRADRKALLDAGALGALVSGSGPTLLALAADGDEAQRIAARVAGRFDRVLVTTAPAGGPVLTAC
ncbi:4-(cytidine 5'-diphospho)-2-C-methyl-D-erythritol kinase [soil metagenome]